MRYELILKQFIAKSFVVFILFAVVFNLSGCIFLLNLPSDTQNIILKAEDGGEYVSIMKKPCLWDRAVNIQITVHELSFQKGP